METLLRLEESVIGCDPPAVLERFWTGRSRLDPSLTWFLSRYTLWGTRVYTLRYPGKLSGVPGYVLLVSEYVLWVNRVYTPGIQSGVLVYHTWLFDHTRVDTGVLREYCYTPVGTRVLHMFFFVTLG